jgi:hypothetical protein
LLAQCIGHSRQDAAREEGHARAVFSGGLYPGGGAFPVKATQATRELVHDRRYAGTRIGTDTLGVNRELDELALETPARRVGETSHYGHMVLLELLQARQGLF